MTANVVDIVIDIIRADSKDAAFEAAEVAAAGFEIPRSVIEADEEDLISAGSVENLISFRQASSRHSRFNSSRCKSWFAADEEFSTLFDLATNGAVIDTAPDFVPSPKPGVDRPILALLKHTLMWHAFELHRNGHGHQV